MSDIADCRAMELLCRERAKSDPQKSLKVARSRGQVARTRTQSNCVAISAKKYPARGPDEHGPNTVKGDLRNNQQS